MAPLLLAGLSLLPKLPDLWGAIASLFGKAVPDSVEAAGKLAGELVDGITGGTIPPAQQVELRGLLYKHEEEIKRLTLDEQRMYLQDVNSARDLKKEETKATGKRDVNLYIIAYFCLAAPICLLSALIYYGLPKMTPEVAMLVGGFIGIVISEYKTVTGFFFGSSKGSSDKSKLIEDLQKGNGK